MTVTGDQKRQKRNLWSEKEDEILRQGITKQGNPLEFNDWRSIAKELPGRTNKDCRKRWLKLDSEINKGFWSEEEDQRLRQGVELFEHTWTKVAEVVKTRNTDQCAKRWLHFLNPELNYNEWTENDDQRLIEEVEKHGHDWKKIVGSALQGRSATDAKNRYAILFRSKSKDSGDSKSSVPRSRRRRRNKPSIFPSDEVDADAESEELINFTGYEEELTEQCIDQYFDTESLSSGIFPSYDGNTRMSGGTNNNLSTQSKLSLPTSQDYTLPHQPQQHNEFHSGDKNLISTPGSSSSLYSSGDSMVMDYHNGLSLGPSDYDWTQLEGLDSDFSIDENALELDPTVLEDPVGRTPAGLNTGLVQESNDAMDLVSDSNDELNAHKSKMVLENMEPGLVVSVLQLLYASKSSVDVKISSNNEAGPKV